MKQAEVWRSAMRLASMPLLWTHLDPKSLTSTDSRSGDRWLESSQQQVLLGDITDGAAALLSAASYMRLCTEREQHSTSLPGQSDTPGHPLPVGVLLDLVQHAAGICLLALQPVQCGIGCYSKRRMGVCAQKVIRNKVVEALSGERVWPVGEKGCI